MLKTHKTNLYPDKIGKINTQNLKGKSLVAWLGVKSRVERIMSLLIIRKTPKPNNFSILCTRAIKENVKLNSVIEGVEFHIDGGDDNGGVTLQVFYMQGWINCSFPSAKNPRHGHKLHVGAIDPKVFDSRMKSWDVILPCWLVAGASAKIFVKGMKPDHLTRNACIAIHCTGFNIDGVFNLIDSLELTLGRVFGTDFSKLKVKGEYDVLVGNQKILGYRNDSVFLSEIISVIDNAKSKDCAEEFALQFLINTGVNKELADRWLKNVSPSDSKTATCEILLHIAKNGGNDEVWFVDKKLIDYMQKYRFELSLDENWMADDPFGHSAELRQIQEKKRKREDVNQVEVKKRKIQQM